MPTLWLVCEERALSDTLALHLRALGDLWIGAAEMRAFREAEAPDLVIATAVDAPGREFAGLERLLEFLRRLPAPGRARAPVLYVESPGHSCYVGANALTNADGPVEISNGDTFAMENIEFRAVFGADAPQQGQGGYPQEAGTSTQAMAAGAGPSVFGQGAAPGLSPPTGRSER